MKENECVSVNKWVSVKDAMPGVGKTVLVKHTVNYETEYHFKENTEEAIAILSIGMIPPYFSYVFHIEDDKTKFLNVTHWHEIPEKRPDFSKLNNGDFLLIKFLASSSTEENKEMETTFVFNNFSASGHLHGVVKSTIPHENFRYIEIIPVHFFHTKIKKITRINFEEKTFEEI